jgi:hypothetical protein
MGQRTRKINANSGVVCFYYGVSNGVIEDFLKANNIERTSGKEDEINEKYITIFIPVADEYKIPDHVYTWVCFDHSIIDKNNLAFETVQQEKLSVEAMLPCDSSKDIKNTLVFNAIITKRHFWISSRVILRSDLKKYKFISKLDFSDFPTEENLELRNFLNSFKSNFLVLETPELDYVLIEEDCYWWV